MEKERKLSPPPGPPLDPPPPDFPSASAHTAQRRKRWYIVLLTAVCALVVGLAIFIGIEIGKAEPSNAMDTVGMQEPPETTAPPVANPQENASGSDTGPYQSMDNWDHLKEAQGYPVDGAMEYEGNVYKLYDLGMTWTEAKTLCEELGGHLVTITSQGEQEAIQRLLEDALRYEYWIGAHYVDGSFVWVTGEPFVYGSQPGAPWGEGQPDHDRSNTDHPEEYVHIFAKDTQGYNQVHPRFTWNDLMNDINVVGNTLFTFDTIGFICEWESGTADLYAP